MQIVIDIPEKDKKFLDMYNDNSFIPKQILNIVLDAVKNGTPLPKHGRLIDEDQIPGDNGWDFSDRLMSTPTIIEADYAESEGKG